LTVARREVPSVLECVTTCTFTWGGQDVNLKGIEDGRPGTLLDAADPVAVAHPQLFRRFTIELAAFGRQP
jgi:hypothetical protein